MKASHVMTNATLNGKPYAENPHIRFEVGYKKLVCAFGAAAVACSAQAKLVNLTDWMEARLGSRDAVYEQCVSAEGTSSGYTPNVLFDGVTYTRTSTAADFSREPAQRKGCLNLGYYGNTPWATMRYDAPGLLLMVR